MKRIDKWLAEDGAEFDDEQSCAAHEARLPFTRLLASVEEAVKADASFAEKIEALGTRLARERRARGEEFLKRRRTAKPELTSQPIITGSAASADKREDEGRDGNVGEAA